MFPVCGVEDAPREIRILQKARQSTIPGTHPHACRTRSSETTFNKARRASWPLP